MKCLLCNKDLTNTGARKFCNRSCAASYNNKISPKRKRVARACLNCGKETFYIKNTKEGKYCSNKCQGEYRFKTITMQRIEDGHCRDSITLRKYLTMTREYKCESCGIAEWNDKKLSLHVDHINGDADNNKPTNLRLLCPNCHSQTETFCGRNKKNTKRSSYMKRYRIKQLY